MVTRKAFWELSGYLRRNIKHLRWRCSCILAREVVLPVPSISMAKPCSPNFTRDSTSTEELKKKRFAQFRRRESHNLRIFPNRTQDRLTYGRAAMHLPCRVGGQASASEEDCERGVAVARGGGARLDDQKKPTVSRNRPGALLPTAAHAQHINLMT